MGTFRQVPKAPITGSPGWVHATAQKKMRAWWVSLQLCTGAPALAGEVTASGNTTAEATADRAASSLPRKFKVPPAKA
ncbi:hypothetical protein [Streptomyces sp. NPDC059072]|uniref:hypothetical protein n=1 Tax=Streptomyces sp. NPDC059072 TaxID=3346715 RepID=UPI0036CED070